MIKIVIGAWAALTVAGLGLLLNYKETPGEAAVAPSSWPSASTLPRTEDRFTLVMIVHPRCPCSRASVGELGRLMTRVGSQVRTYVLMVVPDGVDDSWEHSDLASSAGAIDGVEVRIDRSGREASLFGAATSGQTYLYSRTGELLFSGGITPSRGHYGDNLGSAEIERLALGGEHVAGAAAVKSNVFGCELHEKK